MMTRPHDNPAVFTWVRNASERGGSFIKHLALAAHQTDDGKVSTIFRNNNRPKAREPIMTRKNSMSIDVEFLHRDIVYDCIASAIANTKDLSPTQIENIQAIVEYRGKKYRVFIGVVSL